ncbi:sodium:calcium antiporter [Alteribacillus sp. YIM 98480]|uniref:sodium:calcium antiporter n=1 Tax=Alteribacillus sp. YIM 98480 TaxID=2606599 RepID=UPI00131D52DA|nr:sodium:calcium antiporter [Alteribacillus sp. YIM 98480]
MFIAAAIVSAISAIRLSKYADIISKETKIGGLLAGTILLAVATSLPELTTTISASIIGNADIAVGGGLGSILFNIFVLLVLDIFFRNKRLFLHVSDNHIYTGIIALLLCVVSATGLAVNLAFSIVSIGITSITVALIYLLGMWFISSKQNSNNGNTSAEKSSNISDTKIAINQAIRGFILFALVIFVSGSTLSLSGDAMAQNTGISASAVGSILIALATSIPDAMGVFMALKLANVNMAIGTILGSNLFNILVVAIGDIFYFKGSIWQDTSDEMMYLSFVGFFLTAIVMLIIKRDRTRNTFTYISPSMIAVVSYLIVIGFIILG